MLYLGLPKQTGYLMIDTQAGLLRKNRINLSDCDVVKDIQTRLVLNGLNPVDVAVLEEILYHSVKFPIEDLEESLELPLQTIQTSLNKLHKTELFVIEGNTIIVNKEKRKYLETEFERFSDDFTPNLEFLRAILKRIPIHILPTWYQVPKATNNIFDSLVERYFINPHAFDRYLLEIAFQDEMLHAIAADVFASENLEMPAYTIIKKYGLSDEAFAEVMLFFEYSFVLFSKFRKEGEEYVQMITPLHEWREYLLFVKNTQPTSLPAELKIEKFSEDEYAFSTDMANILSICAKVPLSMQGSKIDPKMYPNLGQILEGFDLKEELSLAEAYLSRLVQKLTTFKLAVVEAGRLKAAEQAAAWICLDREKRAFNAYIHPSNQLMTSGFSPEINTSRNVREIEKSICRILNKDWVYFDDFMRGVLVSFSENSRFEIKREGSHWKFALPEYTKEERSFIETTILEWLFESGIIQTGTYNNKICLKITPLGKSLFKA